MSQEETKIDDTVIVSITTKAGNTYTLGEIPKGSNLRVNKIVLSNSRGTLQYKGIYNPGKCELPITVFQVVEEEVIEIIQKAIYTNQEEDDIEFEIEEPTLFYHEPDWKVYIVLLGALATLIGSVLAVRHWIGL